MACESAAVDVEATAACAAAPVLSPVSKAVAAADVESVAASAAVQSPASAGVAHGVLLDDTIMGCCKLLAAAVALLPAVNGFKGPWVQSLTRRLFRMRVARSPRDRRGVRGDGRHGVRHQQKATQGWTVLIQDQWFSFFHFPQMFVR